MRYLLPGKLLVAGLLIAGLTSRVAAQCPTRGQLSGLLQRLSAREDIDKQLDSLRLWQQQWYRCGYPPDSTYINGLLQTGLAYLFLNDLPAAEQITRQAGRLSRSRRRDVGVDQAAKAYYRLGMTQTEREHQREAVVSLKQAVRCGVGIRTADRWVGGAYLYLAYAHFSAGDFEKAAEVALHGEEVAQRTDDAALVAKLLQEQAKAFNALADYTRARQAAERAVALSQRNKQTALSIRGYKLLGVIAQEQRQFADALRYQQQAFTLARATDDRSAPDYAVTLGLLYAKLGRYDEAIPHFQYGVAHNPNAYGKAFAYENLGAAYWKKREFQRALQYYQQGLVVMPIGFQNSKIASLPDARVIQLVDQKDYLLDLIRNKADTWLEYAKVGKNDSQRLRHALATYRVADQMIDYMRWEHTGQQSKLFWREKTRGMYERAIETCFLLDDAEQAFHFLEKSRAVLLTDKTNELGARQQLSPEQVNEEQRLRQRVNMAQGDMANKSPKDAEYRKTQETLFARQDTLDAFLKQLEQTNQVYYHYKYDNTTPSLTELKHYLHAHNASFVTYFVGDSALYVLGVTGNRATLRPIRQPARAYRQPVADFMTLLSSSRAMSRTDDLKRFLRVGHDLYRQLLQPLNLPAGRLIVSPDGSFVPFDALSRSAGRAEYLVETQVFSYNYSARSFLKKSVEPTRKGIWYRYRRDFLGVAPVKFALNLRQASLPGSDTALKTIAGRFGWSTLLTHEEATRRAFLERAPHTHILHLFTHATADSTKGQEPLLYFTDAPLRLSELGNGEPLNAQLVVLGACQTGIGTNQVGEGVFSLARGFASLGVPSTVSTLWSVQDQATYELTSLFQRYLVEGMPKDSAMQHAKRDWLQSHSGIDNLPGVWAGPILIGDTEPLDLPNRWPLIVGGVLLLIAGGSGLWLWRRKRRTLANVAMSRPRKPRRQSLLNTMTLRRSS